MNDRDIWEAFASTPPAVEPVTNRDNSLAGYQRRLIDEAGRSLRDATQALAEARRELDDLRDSYIALFETAADTQQLLQRISTTLHHHLAVTNTSGLSEILLEIDERLNG